MPERAEGDKSQTRQLSRLELDAKIWAAQERGRKKEEYQPSMPPLDRAEYLVRHLYKIGPTQAAGMGSGPISHQEILAWQIVTGIALQPWEASALRRLSGEYLSESHRAEERGCESPWQPDR